MWEIIKEREQPAKSHPTYSPEKQSANVRYLWENGSEQKGSERSQREPSQKFGVSLHGVWQSIWYQEEYEDPLQQEPLGQRKTTQMSEM